MSMFVILQLIAGLVLLVVGAEALVRGASRMAAALGISPLIIGLTVVAYGTSSPEMAVSIGAGLSGQTDIALGNVVGSNIFNVLFILGISAIIVPLVVNHQLVRLDVPIMIAVSIIAWLFSLDGTISRLEGLALFAGIVAYTGFLIIQARREKNETVQAQYDQQYRREADVSTKGWLINLAYVVGGLAILVLGSRWLVASATAIAQALGISSLIIGLTIVAAGTSLPEVATSIIASIRGERDIAVGNVVGSNIFNLLAVLGLTAVLAPGGITVNAAALNFDIPVMVAVALACLPIFFTGSLIVHWEGLLFLVYYGAYTTYLILFAQQHDALLAFSDVMVFAVIPLTILLLAVLTWRSLLERRRPSA